MFNPLQPHYQKLRRWNQKRKKKRQAQLEKKRREKLSLQFSYGEQDQVDLISYSGLMEETTYVQIGDTFVRTLFISGFPYVANVGWLTMLINFNRDLDISYHIEHVDPLMALPKLNRKITELESTKRSMLKAGKVIGSEITDPLESAMELKDKIQRGQEKLFQISIYMTLSTTSLEELNKTTQILETIMASRLFYIKSATFQQLEGLQSILPRGENLLGQKRNLDSSSAALTFPFVSSELVQESGILYGINKSNNSLVIVDRFSLNNANSIIFAQSGSGKSYTAKVEILRQLMQQTKVIVIDPEREYKQLAKAIGGTYIRMSATSVEKINPFDFSLKSVTGQNGLSEHIQDLTEIISLMAGSLSDEERAVVDKALIDTYKKFDITMRKQKYEGKQKFPLLKDFYKVLKTMKQKDLCNRLDKFVTGSLSSVFTSQTNVDLSNRLVVFDIKDLDESLRQIMILTTANFVHSEVKSDPQKRILVIDEAWLLLQHEESARFLAGLVRRARKHYLGVTLISQQANDFLNQEYGRAIASQSSLRILMKQDTTSIKKVVEEFNLSEYEQQFLLTCERGEALIIADQNHVAVKVVASQKEHPMLTTDPKDLYS
ncbi:MAG: conjugal transfer protein TraC [Candidatus Pacebacteria bacterium CG10_big_fil_rev_8_21_14_0_10_42_12]|nr:MAG: conjugal transfer protein TraC [Candidatus Pacebacteria bacterium CG10_big_fil_rev_8_21_14_0_10_42_12]